MRFVIMQSIEIVSIRVYVVYTDSIPQTLQKVLMHFENVLALDQ